MTANSSDLIEKTVQILDSVSWKSHGSPQTKDYPSYIHEKHSDERTLTDTLLGKFLEQVLGFSVPNDLLTQTSQSKTGKYPDYIPADTYLHSFVFDAKGTDTTNLGSHYAQIKSYVSGAALGYGVLSNMRDLEVYDSQTSQPVSDHSFSFAQLYEDYKQDPGTAPQTENSKRFLRFVERFSRRELDDQGKIKAIIDARHAKSQQSGQQHGVSADLDLDHLAWYLRSIVDNLRDDALQQRNNLISNLQDHRKERIALEIDSIARENNSGLQNTKIDAQALDKFLSASESTPHGVATKSYFYRVAYFSMTRLLLARVWEDIGFIEQTLYNGGFQRWYEQCGKDIRIVLEQAFHYARERYSWLYGIENNYSWYLPSEPVLVDVLYDLARFNLGQLDADVLGSVYEEYLEEVDRKNKGQYYTPRPLVSFIWNRVGFSGMPGIFRIESGEPHPRIALDFSTGSGGFLVEAARRIREATLGESFDHEDPKMLDEISAEKLKLAMNAIIQGLRGSEISPFAYYLTEVNLLIQLTPIVAALHKKDPDALRIGSDYTLHVIHQDSLKLHTPTDRTIIGIDEEHKASHEIYEQDKRYDVVDLEGLKKEVYASIKQETNADYACSNPPYVGEKGHREIFQHVLDKMPFWKDYYQGKQDYFYWFVILGLSKLREGGRLGYITTSYWPTAAGAKQLRRHILANAKIVEIIDFGKTRLFSDAPGQHNMVFVLERCQDEAERMANRPKLVQVKHERPGETFDQRLKDLLEHIESHADLGDEQDDLAEYDDDYLHVFRAPVTQGEFGEAEWNIFHPVKVENTLRRLAAFGEPLSGVLRDAQGVVSRADHLTEDHKEKYLTKQAIQSNKLQVGDGIFVLSETEVNQLSLTPLEQGHVKRTYKNSEIGGYIIDATGESPEYLIYADWNAEISQTKTPGLWGHLSKYRSVIESLRDNYGESYPWYALHRPRDGSLMDSENLVTSRRSPHNRFAYENQGWYENSDLTVLARKEGVPESLKYFLALLNSRALDFWYEFKSKKKGNQREYYAGPLQRVPMRRINFDSATDEQEKARILSEFQNYIEESNYEAANAVASGALSKAQEGAVHDCIEELVNRIIAAKEGLLPYNQYFGTRLAQLPDDASLPEVKPVSVVESMDASEQWTIDLLIDNGDLSATESFSNTASRDSFWFHKLETRDELNIMLRGKGQKPDTLTLSGDSGLIEYLARVLSERRGCFWSELKYTFAPRESSVYEDEVVNISNDVEALRNEFSGLQWTVDQLVLDLYGVTDPDERAIVSQRDFSEIG